MNLKTILFADVLLCIIATTFMFCLVNEKNAVFYTSYIFFIMAILLQIIPSFLAKKIMNKIYVITLHTVSIIYLFIQVFISIISLIIKLDTVKTAIMLGVTLLILYFISILILVNLGLKGSSFEIKEKSKIFFIDKLICDLENVKNITTDTELKSKLSNIIESIKYSDIMSSDNLTEIESNILDSVDCLKKLVASKKINDSKEKCSQIEGLISERNLKCKLYK